MQKDYILPDLYLFANQSASAKPFDRIKNVSGLCAVQRTMKACETHPYLLQGGTQITHQICGRPCSATFSAHCKSRLKYRFASFL